MGGNKLKEWLVKFGFVEMEDTVPEGYPTFKPPIGPGRIYYSEVSGMFNWAAHLPLEIDNQIEIAKLKYVHQLKIVLCFNRGGVNY